MLFTSITEDSKVLRISEKKMGGILYLWSLIIHKQQELRIVTSHEIAYGTSIIRKSCKNQLKIASQKKETTKITLLHRGIVL